MEREKLIITPKHFRGEDGYKTFSIRIKDEIVKEIEIISEKTGRSRNELIGILLSYALARYEITGIDDTQNRK